MEEEVASRWSGGQVRGETWTRYFDRPPAWGVNTLGLFDLASLDPVVERVTVLELLELDEATIRDSVEAKGVCSWTRQVGEAHAVLVVGKSFTLAWNSVEPHLPARREAGRAYPELSIADFAIDSADSDRDGLPDYYELETTATDPHSADTDGDGLSDYAEVCKYRTDPRAPDSDGDGKPDGEWDERREYTGC